ncbi:hypothetical protein CsSME_00037678 [Camellia sinensis var. sinensis]
MVVPEFGHNNHGFRVLFELIWRDYFRFLSIKYGNSLFHIGGPRKVKTRWSQDQLLFESWRDGRTGYPLIDANMKELSMTGFMSNRGRQIVCSFLVRDMGIDWRMGAEWFETCLLDYDPCSNYGNWTYGAGVGNDPREDRYFNIPKQALTYDPEGKYVAYWLPELQALPKEKRNFPGHLYIKQIVPLKYGNSHRNRNSDSEGKGKHMKGYKRTCFFPSVVVRDLVCDLKQPSYSLSSDLISQGDGVVLKFALRTESDSIMTNFFPPMKISLFYGCHCPISVTLLQNLCCLYWTHCMTTSKPIQSLYGL